MHFLLNHSYMYIFHYTHMFHMFQIFIIINNAKVVGLISAEHTCSKETLLKNCQMRKCNYIAEIQMMLNVFIVLW